MTIAKIRVIDLETTAIIPEDGGIVEIGYCDVVARWVDLLGAPCGWEVAGGRGILVNPGHPIPPENSAVHHILDEDVRLANPWRVVADTVFDLDFEDLDAPRTIAYAAHRSSFESAWISDEHTRGLPWICTLKAAYRYWGDAPAHNNSALRYWRKPDGLVREEAMPAHRAYPDAYTTAFLLREFLNDGISVEDLLRVSSQPSILPKCYIGKWRNDGKGTPWKDVDSGFLRWMLDKDFGDDEMFTARHHLEQREIDQRLEREREDMERQYRSNGFAASPPPQELPPLSAYEGQGDLF